MKILASLAFVGRPSVEELEPLLSLIGAYECDDDLPG
jgi:hypothetical protein